VGTGLRRAPVLNSHDRWDVRQILGTVLDPSVDGTRGVATLRFSSRPDVEQIARDVADCIISRVSVGYSVQQWATSKDAAGKRTKTATRWTPAESSFTAIGADPGARNRSDDREDSEECDCPEGEDCQCEENESEGTMSAIPDQIRSAAALLGIRGDFVESLAMRDGVTIETARSELLTHLQGSSPRIDGRASIVRDERVTFMERMLNVEGHRSDRLAYFLVSPDLLLAETFQVFARFPAVCAYARESLARWILKRARRPRHETARAGAVTPPTTRPPCVAPRGRRRAGKFPAHIRHFLFHRA
jgi:hypothetical protein